MGRYFVWTAGFPYVYMFKNFSYKSKERSSKLSSMTGNAGKLNSHSTVAKKLFRVLTFTEHSLDLSCSLEIDLTQVQAVLDSDVI